MSDPWTPYAPAGEEEEVHGVEERRSPAPPGARQFLEEKLKLQGNPLMAGDPGLRDRVLDLFEENFELRLRTRDCSTVPHSAEGWGGRTRPAESPAAEPGAGGEHEDPAQRVVQRGGDRADPEPVGVPHGGGQEEGQRPVEVVCGLSGAEQEDGLPCIPPRLHREQSTQATGCQIFYDAG